MQPDSDNLLCKFYKMRVSDLTLKCGINVLVL